jgi:cell division protein ZapA
VNNNSIDIKILDKEYRVSCPPEEQQALLASARFLNGKLDEIRAKGSIIGGERIAVMAALNLAHELVTGQDYQHGFNDLDSRVKTLQQKIDIALREIEGP